MRNFVKTILIAVVALFVGYFIGAYLNVSDFSSAMAGGNITKANKFYKGIVNPELDAYKEKLMNDSTELQKAAVCLSVLSSRMTEFSGLVDIAMDAAADKEELASQIETLKRIQTLSANVKLAGDEAVNSFNAMVSGEENRGSLSYDQASRNLMLANMMVDRQIKVGKEFVVAVDNYFKNNKVEGNEKLAAARDLWAGYCAGNAVLNADEQELAYWSKKEQILSRNQLATVIIAQQEVLPAQVVVFNQEIVSAIAQNSDLPIAAQPVVPAQQIVSAQEVVSAQQIVSAIAAQGEIPMEALQAQASTSEQFVISSAEIVGNGSVLESHTPGR